MLWSKLSLEERQRKANKKRNPFWWHLFSDLSTPSIAAVDSRLYHKKKVEERSTSVGFQLGLIGVLHFRVHSWIRSANRAKEKKTAGTYILEMPWTECMSWEQETHQTMQLGHLKRFIPPLGCLAYEHTEIYVHMLQGKNWTQKLENSDMSQKLFLASEYVILRRYIYCHFLCWKTSVSLKDGTRAHN